VQNGERRLGFAGTGFPDNAKRLTFF